MIISYKEAGNMLIMECTKYDEHFRIKMLPNRRYSRRTSKWYVPCVRLNVQSIRRWPDLDVSPEAEAAMLKCEEIMNVNKKTFPSQYSYVLPPLKKQEEALNEIYSLKFCALFMWMGTGKTKVAIDKVSCHFIEGKLDRVLVYCPASIRFNWMLEFEKHCPVSYSSFVFSSGREAKYKKWREEAQEGQLQVLIVGVEAMSTVGKAYSVSEDFLAGGRVAVIVDEAHYIKNMQAGRTANIIQLTGKAEYRIALTGTPISQSIMDLYSIFQFLHPDIVGVGDYWSFRNRYTVMGGYENKQIIGYDRVDELMEAIKPYVFQCTKDEALDLPDKVYVTRAVSLPKKQIDMYKTLKKEHVLEIMDQEEKDVQDTIVAENILTLYGLLQQVTSGFYMQETENGKEALRLMEADKNPKVKELKSIIAEIPDSEQVIIWAKYREEVAIIHEALSDYRCQTYDKGCSLFIGGMSDKDKEKSVRDFMQKQTRYFVATQKTGGTGLTLNEACYTVYFSNSFSLTDRLQSEDRNHRKGQERSVTYFDLIVPDTVDERVLSVLADKQDVSTFVMNCLKEGETWID